MSARTVLLSAGGLVFAAAVAAPLTAAATTTDPTATTDPANPSVSGSTSPDDGRTVAGIELGPAGEPLVELNGWLYVTNAGDVYRMVDQDDLAGGLATPSGSYWMAPPPPPPTWEIAQLTDAGLEAVVSTLDEHGMFDPAPDYGDLFVTDIPGFSMIVHRADTASVHELLLPHEQIPGDAAANAARANLVEVIDYFTDLEIELGDDLSDFEPYVPARWQISQSYEGGPGQERWRFQTSPDLGCSDFAGDTTTVDGVDAVTGRYKVDGTVVDVSPMFPWQDC